VSSTERETIARWRRLQEATPYYPIARRPDAYAERAPGLSRSASLEGDDGVAKGVLVAVGGLVILAVFVVTVFLCVRAGA
jgi:hypothetical protein